ncbi:MAG: hypothetical protein JM58_13885 [Peptococcaceae bacterium BICA1-8]|nr:MAG: hypothetical protein JM58_13885 [Peptococcaceae bacterium BICA1-8]
MLRISGIKISITKNQKEAIEKEIMRYLSIPFNDIVNYKIFKQSIDARKTERVYFVYTIDVEVKNEAQVHEKNKNKVNITPDLSYKYVQSGKGKLVHRPVIVGTGPAGLFCGLILAQMGYRPILLERGQDVEARTKAVDEFWEKGILDEESNVQFGEGGAGTFSDGKLTTLIKNSRCRKILEELVSHGAPEEILYSYKPHIGTDILKTVVTNLRKKIIELGGEVRFNSKVTELTIEDQQVRGVIINGQEALSADLVILAVGHSARDTFEMLYNKGVKLSPKAFAIGVRIEHPQAVIDGVQYGQLAGHENLGAADYKLVYHASTGRGCYTFCMCPGGYVVNASSEKNRVVTNGMSYFARDGANANSALLVGIEPSDFEEKHPLAGIEFQRKWERLAFQLAGSNYSAPTQLVGDFLQDVPSTSLNNVKPSFKPGTIFVELKKCLPSIVVETLKEAILYFDKKILGFADKDAVLTGVETRSSSPVRIERDENYQAVDIHGLYPTGEGAGYAGGIVSAAIDGIMAAEAIVSKYAKNGAG